MSDFQCRDRFKKTRGEFFIEHNQNKETHIRNQQAVRSIQIAGSSYPQRIHSFAPAVRTHRVFTSNTRLTNRMREKGQVGPPAGNVRSKPAVLLLGRHFLRCFQQPHPQLLVTQVGMRDWAASLVSGDVTAGFAFSAAAMRSM